jgi:hypothetical protein
MSRKTQKRLSSFFLLCFILIVIFIITVIVLPSFICSPAESFNYNNKQRDLQSNPTDSLKFSVSQEPENLSTANGFCKLFQTLSDYYGKTDSYIVDPQSKYYSDVSNVINQSKDIVLKKAKDLKKQGFTPLIMSDLDDTLWCTYNESKNSNYCYDANKFSTYAEQKKLPTIFPVFNFLRTCALNDIIPIFVTGRSANDTQNNMTLSQLQNISFIPGKDFFGGIFGWRNIQSADVVGNPNSGIKSINGIFMHDFENPIKNATDYKSGTRKFIEENGLLGFDKVKFVASIGDQWSDSNGGYTEIQIKVPNPLYFLP